MIYSNTVTIWYPDRENIVINWPYEFRDQKHVEQVRTRLKKLYEGEVFFTLKTCSIYMALNQEGVTEEAKPWLTIPFS